MVTVEEVPYKGRFLGWMTESTLAGLPSMLLKWRKRERGKEMYIFMKRGEGGREGLRVVREGAETVLPPSPFSASPTHRIPLSFRYVTVLLGQGLVSLGGPPGGLFHLWWHFVLPVSSNSIVVVFPPPFLPSSLFRLPCTSAALCQGWFPPVAYR